MSNENYEEYYNSMIEAFVDKPSATLWYQNAFSKFSIHGVDKLTWHWSWWAFGGGAAFLLYRKQYMAALILFTGSMILGMIPFVSIILMILAGGYSPYFVYKGFKRKLTEIEATVDTNEKRIETMREVGGYHTWVIWVYAILSIFILMYVSSVVLLMVSQLS